MVIPANCPSCTVAIPRSVGVQRTSGAGRRGTARDNWEDSIQKGRQTVVRPGEANGSAKLTAAEVRTIRRSAARVADLVRQYRVNDGTIRRVIQGINWRHVPQEEPAEIIAAE